ncbi:hypothetical protein [Bosea massiliensis]|uniref:Tail fiber protein n=1 Tax=Bosea massiliensis TaxID=151419 RepID=A0ABW0P9F7_9HYPH
MAITDNRSPNRDYLLPHEDNDLTDDVLRIISAFTAIDADVHSLLASVSARALLSHTHSFAEVPGLQTALDGKSNVGHLHTLSSLTDVDTTGAAAGMFLKRIAGGWVPANLAIVDTGGLQTALDGKVPLKGSSIVVPRGNTAGRPTGTSTESLFRYNTTIAGWEGWDGEKWGKISGGAPTSETPPSPAQNGDFWFHSGLGVLFIHYVDGDGDANWISIGSASDPLFNLLRANNLSDLASPDTALTNLGANADGRDIVKNATAFGASLAKSATAAAGRAVAGAPAIPQSGAGVGQVVAIQTAFGSGYIAPSGGTWFIWASTFSDTNSWSGNSTTVVVAGGASALAGPGGTNRWVGFAWRIA